MLVKAAGVSLTKRGRGSFDSLVRDAGSEDMSQPAVTPW